MRALLALLLLSLLSPGCTFFKRLAGRATVNIAGEKVHALELLLIPEEKTTICPGEPVQVRVRARVGEPARTYVTWAYDANGRANKNDKLDFAIFDFAGRGGTFEKDGIFVPSPDIWASLESGFTLVVGYPPDPSARAEKTFAPDYDCFYGVYVDGPAGFPGEMGARGEMGRQGDSGDELTNGGRGGDGEDGNPGGDGGHGGNAPRVEAAAVLIKTPFYEKLLLVRVISPDAPSPHYFLFDPALERRYIISARGGPGGPGGSGGDGGDGGRGGDGLNGGDGGRGGDGGDGGRGGDGGDGGEITLYYAAEQEEILSYLALHNEGGPAGRGGDGGRGGSGGLDGNHFGNGKPGRSGERGFSGQHGQPGREGRPGPPPTIISVPARDLFAREIAEGLQLAL